MILLEIFFSFCIIFHLNQAAIPKGNNVVILLYDGFRWDFLNKTELPTFQWIVNNGISAKWMEPVFMTKTYPAHFSIATGLYPENHGIVGNNFYDSVFGKRFYENRHDKKWWKGGEPIWITAEMNNISTSLVRWPGNVKYEVGKKTYQTSKTIDGEHTIRDFVKTLTSGTRLVLYRHDRPDSVAHKKPLDSQEFIDALKFTDKKLKQVIDEMKKQNVFNRTNIIIVADHGMEKIVKRVSLKDARDTLNTSLIKRVQMDSGVLFSFDLKDDLDESTKNEFLNNLEKFLGDNFTLYKSRDEIPERLHFRGAKNRIGNYNVFAKPGYQLFEGEITKGIEKTINDHGYDSELPNMKPIFLAYGPDFKNMPRKVKEVHQVDIYGIALKLLGLDNISPKNGSISRIENIINDK